MRIQHQGVYTVDKYTSITVYSIQCIQYTPKKLYTSCIRRHCGIHEAPGSEGRLERDVGVLILGVYVRGLGTDWSLPTQSSRPQEGIGRRRDILYQNSWDDMLFGPVRTVSRSVGA